MTVAKRPSGRASVPSPGRKRARYSLRRSSAVVIDPLSLAHNRDRQLAFVQLVELVAMAPLQLVQRERLRSPTSPIVGEPNAFVGDGLTKYDACPTEQGAA